MDSGSNSGLRFDITHIFEYHKFILHGQCAICLLVWCNSEHNFQIWYGSSENDNIIRTLIQMRKLYFSISECIRFDGIGDSVSCDGIYQNLYPFTDAACHSGIPTKGKVKHTLALNALIQNI